MDTIDRKRTMETASNNTWESKTGTKRALPRPSPKFTVTYVSKRNNYSSSSSICSRLDLSHSNLLHIYIVYFQSRLCDGGAQEMTTAVCTIREVFPDASISTYRRTSEEDVALGTPNPEVVITTDENKTVVWSSKQKNLYQKYPKKRKKSMSQIRKACEALASGNASASSSKKTTVAARVIASAKKLSPRAASPVSPRPTNSSIPLPTSLNIRSRIVNEVSEDFSTAERSCELDENGVCTNAYANPLL